MLCRSDYAERVVASFFHQIQSEYYGGNRSVSIDGITLEHFSILANIGINVSNKSCHHQVVFHSLLSYDRKQDYAANTAYSNRFIVILK